jgi:DNA-binding protein HU-beta
MFGFGSTSDKSSQSQSSSIAGTTRNATGGSQKEHINRKDIVEEVASTHDLSIAQSERIVSTVFNTIVEAVVDGKQARVGNFGSFDSFMSKATKGRNPKTGEVLQIPSKKRIRFKAYDNFK